MTQNENEGLQFLDILAIISFALQMQNQTKIFGLNDLQAENNRVAEELHRHLTEQDKNIKRIMEVLGIETD